ncbi:MAG TPA: shikimate dehydrogenase [Gemmatimonadaceae bacterium]|nr:shikimate dehydrogenase [Gemmatimonadaceae bacterium]
MTAWPRRLVLLGHPVAHSLSPRFQNAALRSAKIPVLYEALDVLPDELDGTLDALIAERSGGNVTIPYKVRLAARCGRLTPLAERTGAINTFLVTEDGVLIGDNTDVGGFEKLARDTVAAEPAGMRVALLGAGGGARAVLAAVERWRECTVALYNRSAERAAELAAHFSVVTDVHQDADRAVHGAGLVVNATSVGMTDDRFPVELEAVPKDAAVVDLVYRSEETAWIRAARARGHRAADGFEMLVEQGALAFEQWFGAPAPREVMRRAIRS